jgi:hypothetical protein
MAKKTRDAGLDRRDLKGLIRQKNASTSIDTLRKTYGEGFAAGCQGSTRLDALLDRTGTKTLSEYLKRAK